MDNQQGSLNKDDWTKVPGMVGYFIDQDGQILSVKRGKVKYLSLCSHAARGRKGYYRVKINGAAELAHRVVASSMIGRTLKKSEHVNHKNGDTLNNHPSNLEVVSHRENVEHAVRNGLYCSGKEWYLARGMSKD